MDHVYVRVHFCILVEVIGLIPLICRHKIIVGIRKNWWNESVASHTTARQPEECKVQITNTV